MTDAPTNNLADYIAQKGVRLTVLSKATGISHGILRRSLCSRDRTLRAGEYLAICRFLDRDPNEFYKEGSE